MSKRAIIFDLDGTLWDVTESTFISANIIANKYGLKEVNKEAICSGFGCNKEESAKIYFPYLKLEESLKYIEEIGTINIDYLNENGGILFDQEVETIRELNNKYNLFIVSNTSKRMYIEAFLKNNGMKEYFKDYIAASSLDISKGDAIKKIIKDNSIEESVYVGDTRKDQEAAYQARIPFVQAKYGFGEDLNETHSINTISELPEELNKVFEMN